MNEKLVHYESYDGLVLEGTYLSPPKGPDASILLVHGITADRDEWGFNSGLAKHLSNYGIASFRIDFRCHGVDKTPFRELSLLGIVSDIDAAFSKLNQLTKNRDIPRYILGCSFSGGLSAYWARAHSDQVTKIFLCYPVIDYEEDITKTAGDWRRALAETGHVDYVGKEIGRPLLNEVPYVSSIEAVLNPACRIVIFHGDLDSDVPIELSKKYCRSDSCRLFVVPGAEHGFTKPGDLDISDPESLRNFRLVFGEIVREITGTGADNG